MLRRLRIENLVLIHDATLELAAGLNALTGETGAGKTIFAEALGLLLGNKGDAGLVGSAGTEAFVEAEFDDVEGVLDEGDDGLASLLELRPEGEPGIVLARRVFADGRTRAYAWGRTIAREDLAAATERLVAVSGQFEQRRLARPAFQLELLDRFVGEAHVGLVRDLRSAWDAVGAARKRLASLEGDSDAARVRLSELRALVEDTEGLVPGQEDDLRAERERLRHVAELGEGLLTAISSIEPDEGDGAAGLVAGAERAIAPLEAVAPELAGPAGELRDIAIRLREVASDLNRCVASLDVDPGRLDHVEEALERISTARRRHGAGSFEELLGRRDSALAELDAMPEGDPIAAANEHLERVEAAWGDLADEIGRARRAAAPTFAAAVSGELRDVGMGEGELRVELVERSQPGRTGRDEAAFLVRPNVGLPFAPVAQTASGGELSRIALAIAAVAGGETLVFDEIDAGIGGVTAHRVAAVLGRLAERAQVVTITHLPQIASVAERHFRVEKVPGDPTHTRIEALDDAERRDELERMLGGEEFVAALTGRDPG